MTGWTKLYDVSFFCGINLCLYLFLHKDIFYKIFVVLYCNLIFSLIVGFNKNGTERIGIFCAKSNIIMTWQQQWSKAGRKVGKFYVNFSNFGK